VKFEEDAHFLAAGRTGHRRASASSLYNDAARREIGVVVGVRVEGVAASAVLALELGITERVGRLGGLALAKKN
jgi:adenine/guanine phosphoribosyltransferase-like PRPP-binding protein